MNGFSPVLRADEGRLSRLLMLHVLRRVENPGEARVTFLSMAFIISSHCQETVTNFFFMGQAT